MSVIEENLDTLLEQYKDIQSDGPCNMLDQNCVQKVANDRGYHELVVAIEEGDYHSLIYEYSNQ